MAVRNIFMRTGELHSKTFLNERLQRDGKAAQECRDDDIAQRQNLRKQLKDQEDLLKTVTSKLKEKNILLGSVRAEIFDLRQEYESQKAATQGEIGTLIEERNKAKAEAVEHAKVLSEDRDAARAEIEVTKAALQKAKAEAVEHAKVLSEDRDAARAEVEVTKAALSTLQQNNHTKTTAMNELTTQLAEVQTTVENRLLDIASLGNELIKKSEALKLATATTESQKIDLENMIAQLETTSKQAEETRTLHNRECEALRADAENRHRTEKQLEAQVNLLMSELDELRLRLGKAENSLNDRLDDIAILGREIKKSTQDLEHARKEDELGKLRLTLEAAEQARDEARQRVSDLENSNSWRITSPLRKASQMASRDRSS